MYTCSHANGIFQVVAMISMAHPFFIRVGSEWRAMVEEVLLRSAHSESICRATTLSDRSAVSWACTSCRILQTYVVRTCTCS